MKRKRGAEGTGRRRYDSAELLVCVECSTFSDDHAWGWRAYRMDDPELEELPALAFYCPSCSEREFGCP
jgi:hypothetical protein